MTLAGEEDLTSVGARVGRLRSCVGCVVGSRSRRNADGEHGIVSPASSSSSISILDVGTRPRDGVRGTVWECLIGNGDEFCAIVFRVKAK